MVSNWRCGHRGRVVFWSPLIADMLRPALGVDGCDESAIRQEIDEAKASLVEIGEAVAVLRAEDYKGHRELVVVAIAGKGLKAAMHDIWAIACNAGAQRIRMHTQHRAANAVFRLLRPWGGYLAERRETENVYFVEVHWYGQQINASYRTQSAKAGITQKGA